MDIGGTRRVEMLKRFLQEEEARRGHAIEFDLNDVCCHLSLHSDPELSAPFVIQEGQMTPWESLSRDLRTTFADRFGHRDRSSAYWIAGSTDPTPVRFREKTVVREYVKRGRDLRESLRGAAPTPQPPPPRPPTSPTGTVGTSPKPAAQVDDPRTRDVLRVLCRLPISRGQLVLYRLAADDPESGFTSTVVKELLELDQAQHRGLMAALTVRINNTPRETSVGSKPGLSLVFDQHWDGRENTYRPQPELLAAIQLLPELAEVMASPVEDVVNAETLNLQLPAGIPPKPVLSEPSPAPPQKVVTKPFAGLLDVLDEADLVYSSELVANLLLALQVKRFVILTGISGTGKTRIAQVLAERFGVRRRVEAPMPPGDSAALLTVRPYMLKHKRMNLPKALAVQVPGLTANRGAGTLKARWPGGAIDLAIYVDDSVLVMFRGELRAWFETTFSEGDTFVARVDGPPDAAPDTLVLGPAPKAPVREERVPNAEVIAVRPDWTDHRGLLGAYNPLTRQYLRTPFLDLLLRADEERRRAKSEGRAPAPFFLLLDEMNLARVEHYFADFLSALESGEMLHLHDSAEIEDGLADEDGEGAPLPRRLAIPPNLFFIGTVNVDESTYMFSPKVLDRAFTIELNSVDLGGLSTGLERGGDLELGSWSGRLDPPLKPGRADWKWLDEREDGALATEVRAFHALLARQNRHFGYRVATELARFVRLAAEQATEPGAAAWAALDLALLQKVLVKLHGTRHELSSVLDSLLRFTLVGADGDESLSELGLWQYLPEESVVRRRDEAADIDAVFPRSAAKLWRMRDRLRETGFTSWIE